MFNKFKLIDSHIRFLRYAIEWQENGEAKAVDCVDGKEAEAIKDMLKTIGIESEIEQLKIPLELEGFDGVMFDGDMTDATFFVNSSGKYNPISLKLEMLKKELSASDYKAIKYGEGLISNEVYLPIREERQMLRDEINRLQEALEQ